MYSLEDKYCIKLSWVKSKHLSKNAYGVHNFFGLAINVVAIHNVQ